MGIFKSDFDIGKTATEDKFLQKLRKERRYIYVTANKNEHLIAGAAQAFFEGRPGNIQAALLHAKTAGRHILHSSAVNILFDLSEKSGTKCADITLALAKILEEDRSAVLSNALNEAIEHDIGGEPFFSLLLDAGAEANARICGYQGNIIATAIHAKQPISVTKLLHDRGGSFDDTRTTMLSLGYDANELITLDHYQKELTGKTTAPEADMPAPEEADMRDVMLEILAELKEITRRLPPPAEPAANANQPEGKTPLRIHSSKGARL